MDTRHVDEKLRQIAHSPDFIVESGRLAEGWRASANGFAAVEPILRFMEAHPELDFGMPGPLVHFLEAFYGAGYEDQLLDSVGRKPTAHTLWMLNRVINGTKDLERRMALIAALTASTSNPSADVRAREDATRFLRRLRGL